MARVRQRAIADYENTVNVKGASARLNAVDNFTYITTTGNHDLSGLTLGNHKVMVNVALADTNYIQLPEATTENGGMHIRIIVALAQADKVNVGFVTTNIVGGAQALGDANEGNAPTDIATVTSAVGTGNKRVEFDLNAVAKAGWQPGSILDFHYTGVANVVLYRGDLLSEVDDPTLATHFTTTAVNA